MPDACELASGRADSVLPRSGVAVSAIVPVKNEEANIAACLESLAWAGEIWVVDSHSEDRTVDIARRYTDKIVQFEFSGAFPKKKNWALENLPLAHDWVFLIDADERVTPQLRDEIASVFAGTPAADGYYVNRRLIFLGRWIRHCGWYPSWNMRLFRRGLGRYERLDAEDVENAGDVEVHEHVLLHGREGYLQHDLLHEDFKSVYHFVDRHNRYSNWDARVYANLRGRASGHSSLRASLLGSPLERKRFLKRIWVKTPARPLLRFIWMYLVKRGFLDGRPGRVFCSLMSSHEAIIAAKIYESDLRRAPESAPGDGRSAVESLR